MPVAETFNGVVVAAPVGHIPYAYLVRSAQSQISVLDLRTETHGYFEYFCHNFTGNEKDREMVKKILRIKVYGSGIVSTDAFSGILTVGGGEGRQDQYVYSPAASNLSDGILWEQGCLGLKSRSFSVKIQLKGFGLKLRECSMEYTLVN